MPKQKKFKTFAQEQRENELRKLYGNLMTLSTVQEELGRVVEKTAREWAKNMPVTQEDGIAGYRVSDYADLEYRHISEFYNRKPEKSPEIVERAAELRELYGGMMTLTDICKEMGHLDPKSARQWLSGVAGIDVNGRLRFRVADIAEREYQCREAAP